MRRLLAATLAAVSAAFAAPALADPGEVVLTNGDVLKGDVRETPDAVVVEHPVLGRLTVARAQVKEVRGAAVAPTAAPYQAFERPSGALADAWLVGGPCDPCAPAVPVCEKPWKGKLGIAGSLTSGNTDTFSLVAAGEVVHTHGPWAEKLGLLYVYNEDSGNVTADRWNGILRVDRMLDARSYLFAQVQYDQDDPGNLEYRWTGTLGYGRFLLKQADQELKVEVGAGAVLQKYKDTAETTDPVGYVGAHYLKTWKDKKALHADLEFTPNFGDFDLTLTRLALAFDLPLAEHWKFVLGARFDYVNQPPDGREKLDTLVTFGISYDM